MWQIWDLQTRVPCPSSWKARLKHGSRMRRCHILGHPTAQRLEAERLCSYRVILGADLRQNRQVSTLTAGPSVMVRSEGF